MPETMFNNSYSFSGVQSYGDDDSKYDVVAHIGVASDRKYSTQLIEGKVASKVSELSVNNLHHILKDGDLDQLSNLGFGFSIKRRERGSTYSNSTNLKGAFKLLQKWSGYVISVNGDEFAAIIKDKSNPDNPDEEVVIAVDELSPSDQMSLSVGSEFFWSIGYETNAFGSRFRKSEIRLRRLAPFCREELEYAERKADEMESLFEGL